MRLRSALASLLLCAGIACGRPKVKEPAEVVADVRARARAAEAVEAATQAWLADGLDENEAVALALGRNPDFQADLTELGVTAGVVAEVAQLRNPVLTLLLPWGPKQLEATARWPIETLWLRPKRVAAAGLDAEAVAQRLVANGLELAAQTRMAWADAALAAERAPLVAETVGIRRQIAEIAEKRLQIGEASPFETGVARDDRARALEDQARQRAQEEATRQRLGAMVGLPEGDFTLSAGIDEPSACTDAAALLAEARVARPELRAAELTVEAAAKRAGLPRLEALGLTVVVDANQRGTEGFEAGPGFDVNVPLNLGGAGKQRASAELARARARLLALHQQVGREVREARTRLMEARAVLGAWDAVVGEREATLSAADERYKTGEEPLLVVLESRRQLDDARLRRAEVKAELRRARARLARVVGHEQPCGGGS